MLPNLFAFACVVLAVVMAVKSPSATNRVASILFAVLVICLGSGFHSAMAAHAMHGDMNGGVGMPYVDLINHFKSLADQGRYDELKAKLNIASKNSNTIYDVWLNGDSSTFRNEIDQLIATDVTPISPSPLLSAATNAPSH